MINQQRVLSLLLAGLLCMSTTTACVSDDPEVQEEQALEEQATEEQEWEEEQVEQGNLGDGGFVVDIDYHKKYKSSAKSFKTLGSSAKGSSGS